MSLFIFEKKKFVQSYSLNVKKSKYTYMKNDRDMVSYSLKMPKIRILTL